MSAVSQNSEDRLVNSNLTNLRDLQEEALNSVFIGTVLLGLGLVYLTFSRADLWYIGLWGIGLIVVPFLLQKVFAGQYLTRAWVFIIGWMVVILNLTLTFPSSSIEMFLIFPTLLAAIAINPWAGAGTVLFGLFSLFGLSEIYMGNLISEWGLLIGLLVGGWVITWLALRPIYAALNWSWQQYNLGRQELMTARDAQADLKQAVKDLANASAQMIRLNQLLSAARHTAEEAERAKAEFVANVSHELRTPLNMVIGFSEIMLNSGNAYGRIPKTLRADLAVILRNSQHLSALIDDVLDLSQIEAGRMALTKELVNLYEVIDSAAVAIRPLFESKQLYLNVDIPAQLELVCDRTRLREVFLNLLSNAGRFVAQGGVTVRGRVEEENVIFSVADTGPGISPQDQARLFQPFQQADGTIRRRYGGSGLGLSISKHFVELHGGKMWLESELGKGTTIFFSLPFHIPFARKETYNRWLNPDWEYRQRTRKWSAPKPDIKPRILVVENSSQMSRVLLRYLDGVEIISKRTLGDVAQEMTNSPAQAMVINLPQIDQTIEQVWKQNLLPAGVPAVVCYLPGEEEEARQLGVQRYLIKPVSRDDFIGALDQLGVISGTLMIVDDDRDAIQLFWRMITSTSRGYRVITASNGGEAISLLETDTPNAILLDLSMPTLDGFQFLARKREKPEWQNIPVIIMSARDPAGHPVVASSIGITRGGGISVPQLLSLIKYISDPFSVQGDKGNPESQAAPAEIQVS